MQQHIEVKQTKTGTAPVDPVALPIAEACRMSGLSRSEVYRRLAAGDLRAVKCNSRTLVLVDSLRGLLLRLPPATFRAQGKAA